MSSTAGRPAARATGDPGAYLVVIGATGTGKSAFALDLADETARRGRPAEIVNTDAMQLYRGMDIGTAKLPSGERRGIPHHLFDELDVTAEASVEWFQTRARETVSDIAGRGHLPILVGGSGLYVSGAVFDFRFPGTDPVIRAEFEALLDGKGTGAVFRLLRERDPAAAEAIGPFNGRRIVRALEVGALTGEPFAVGLPDDAPTFGTPHFFGVQVDRAELVARLDDRVDGMWRDGLLDEVRDLLPKGLEHGVTASRAIGYAQAIAQLKGETSEDEAKDATRALTRRYARRQVSWFRRYPRVSWIDASGPAGPATVAAAVVSAADRLLG